jgi:hypothetical protein
MDELADLARTLLPSMADPASGFFVRKVEWTAGGPRPRDLSPLYTAMSVVGLLADSPGGAGGAHDAVVTRALDALVAPAAAPGAPTGLTATTLWALALAGDDRAPAVLRALASRRPARDSSMELGLVLAGLAAALEGGAPPAPQGPRAAAAWSRAARRAGDAARAELLRRFSDGGRVFRPLGRAGGSAARPLEGVVPRPRRLLRHRLASFATQVYPVHGLARYARATGSAPPVELSRAAERLRESQGPLGQWWWIYDPRAPAVLDGYPVYSVHQDAMALMALLPVQALGLGTFDAELARGLAWLFGANELRTPLVDVAAGTISRCIQRAGGEADGEWGMSPQQRRAVLAASWGLRRAPGTAARAEALEVLHECRPYHLGWVLYARSLLSDR